MEDCEPRAAVVVEDDGDIRDLLVSVLTQAGFAVHAAGTGTAGVELVRAHCPLVTTLDVSLPDIDGFEVARRVRTFSGTYIVMLTARDEEIDTLMGLDAGADDYVTKPFRPRELRARIQAMLRRPRQLAGVATGRTRRAERPGRRLSPLPRPAPRAAPSPPVVVPPAAPACPGRRAGPRPRPQRGAPRRRRPHRRPRRRAGAPDAHRVRPARRAARRPAPGAAEGRAGPRRVAGRLRRRAPSSRTPTSGRWRSTSPTCAASSATTPATRGSSRPSGAPATASRQSADRPEHLCRLTPTR